MNPLPPFPNCSNCNYAIVKGEGHNRLYVCKVDGCFLWDLQFNYLCEHGCLKHHDALKYLTENVEVIANIPKEIARKEGRK